MDENRINRRARLAFAVALTGVFAAGALWLASWHAEFTTYRIETADPVSGLIADSPVEFHGVEVGHVRSVELTRPGRITVLLDVKSGAPVTSSTVATITARGLAMRGFTGYVYVALEDDGIDARPLAILPGQRYPTIRTAPSQIVNMDLAITQVNQNVQKLTTLVQSTLDAGTIASLKETVASLEQVSRTIARNDARMERLVANAERASGEMPAFMQATRGTMGRVDTLLDPRTVASMRSLAVSLEHVTGMLADNNAKLDKLIGRGEEATRDLAPLVLTTHETLLLLQEQVLPQAHRTLTHLDDLSTSLSGVARKASRDPSVLLRGAKAENPGPGEAR